MVGVLEGGTLEGDYPRRQRSQETGEGTIHFTESAMNHHSMAKTIVYSVTNLINPLN